MTDEHERIEKMRAEGKVTAEEAERLKAALGKSGEAQALRRPPPVAEPVTHKLAILSALALPVGAAAAIVIGGLGASLATSRSGREIAISVGFWLLFLIVIVGGILGQIALSAIRREPDRFRGRGLALFGRLVALLALIVIVFGAVSYVMLRTVGR